MRTLVHFLYNLDLALLVGGMFLYTFVVTPAIFGAYDRDTAAGIVDALFKGYFIYTLALSAFLLPLLALWCDRAGRAFKASALMIVLAIGISAYVKFKLHPQILEVKRQVPSFVTTPADSPERQRFGRLHAVSAVLNLLLLADGVVLLLISTASRK